VTSAEVRGEVPIPGADLRARRSAHLRAGGVRAGRSGGRRGGRRGEGRRGQLLRAAAARGGGRGGGRAPALIKSAKLQTPVCARPRAFPELPEPALTDR
jgi:hypothetical protein